LGTVSYDTIIRNGQWFDGTISKRRNLLRAAHKAPAVTVPEGALARVG
jgi:N-acyl-D-aspartate/D-glutamate deacylase